MAACDQLAFSTPRRVISEQSTMIVSVRLRNRAAAADATTPTNMKYRLDSVPSGVQVSDWTTLTVANPATITLSSTQTKIQNDTRTLERKRLSVAVDYGLATQFIDSMSFEVSNLPGLA